jgi:hypothetical protein
LLIYDLSLALSEELWSCKKDSQQSCVPGICSGYKWGHEGNKTVRGQIHGELQKLLKDFSTISPIDGYSLIQLMNFRTETFVI